MNNKPKSFEEVQVIDADGKEYTAEYAPMMDGWIGFIDLETDCEIDNVVGWRRSDSDAYTPVSIIDSFIDSGGFDQAMQDAIDGLGGVKRGDK